MTTGVREARERLAAVDQYLADFFLSPSGEGYLDLPAGAMDKIHEGVRALGDAGSLLHRIDPGGVGGERVLHESPAPNHLLARRARAAFCGAGVRDSRTTDNESLTARGAPTPGRGSDRA